MNSSLGPSVLRLYFHSAVAKLIFQRAFFYVSKCRICTESTLCVRVDLIRENILSIPALPGVQLTTEDSADLTLGLPGLAHLFLFFFYDFTSLLRECFGVLFCFFICLSFLSITYFEYDLNNNNNKEINHDGHDTVILVTNGRLLLYWIVLLDIIKL